MPHHNKPHQTSRADEHNISKLSRKLRVVSSSPISKFDSQVVCMEDVVQMMFSDSIFFESGSLNTPLKVIMENGSEITADKLRYFFV